jgi:hypothetical protein
VPRGYIVILFYGQLDPTDDAYDIGLWNISLYLGLFCRIFFCTKLFPIKIKYYLNIFLFKRVYLEGLQTTIGLGQQDQSQAGRAFAVFATTTRANPTDQVHSHDHSQ